MWILSANDLMNKLEMGKKPTVAGINGISLGGGLELSMACNARVCTFDSTLGLPELKIGLIPGKFKTNLRMGRYTKITKTYRCQKSNRYDFKFQKHKWKRSS